MLEGQTGYLLPNTDVQVNFHNDRPIGLELPPSVVLTVIETDPEIKNFDRDHFLQAGDDRHRPRRPGPAVHRDRREGSRSTPTTARTSSARRRTARLAAHPIGALPPHPDLPKSGRGRGIRRASRRARARSPPAPPGSRERPPTAARGPRTRWPSRVEPRRPQAREQPLRGLARVADEHHVASGAGRALPRSTMPARDTRALHREVVTEHDAVETEATAEDLLEPGPARTQHVGDPARG